MTKQRPDAGTARPTWQIRLLGGLAVAADQNDVKLSSDAERLIAFLALQEGPVSRLYVAGSLWGENSRERAQGNLRSALWRLRHKADGIVEVDHDSLTVSEAVAVDVHRVHAEAQILQSSALTGDLPQIESFTIDLLPGWYDEWVLVEQERHRQRCLHALEQLSIRLTELHQFGSAIEAALASMTLEPLRESAHRQLIAIHLAEGNQSEALRQYHQYEELIRSELGIAPSPLLEDLISRSLVTPR